MKTLQWQGTLEELQHTRLFNGVTDCSLENLVQHLQAYNLEKGEILLTPFSRNEHLYILLQGELRVYLGSLEGQPVTTLCAGDCSGEISFIDRDQPSAYVVAAEPSTVIALHRDSLMNLLLQSSQLTQNLLELLCSRVRKGNRILIDSEQNANVDTLTGAFNRRWLEHVYERESTRCSYNAQPLSMLMLDVDSFKPYNDEHGHLAGDYALSLVAHTLRNQLRPKDSLTRYGGEEFVILLPEISIEEARSIGERLRQSLERISSFYSPIGILPGVTISIGLAQMQPSDSLQALLSRADEALYQAKQAGRNRICG